ncbi:TetR/AcrR family transcriptional regulator [Devosia sp. A449]
MTDTGLSARKRGRPRSGQAERLSELVIETALVMFRQRGFEATSIGAVAEACGMSKHTLYRRFDSKEALFVAAIAQERAAVLAQLAAIDVSGLDTMAALHETCAALFEVAVSPGSADLYRMCIGAVPKFPMIGAEFAITEQRIQDLLIPLVAQAQAEGILAAQDPIQLSGHLYYSIIGEIWGHALLGLDYVKDYERRKSVFDANWAMFLNGTRLRQEPQQS